MPRQSEPGMPGDAAAVEIRAAEKVFADGTRALAPVDLTLGQGEFASVIGPSGCGKSTLLSLVAGLTPPTRGHLSWWGGGFDQVGRPGRRMSIVFQDATLMPWARVETNVRLPFDLAGETAPDVAPRVARALERVGLGDVRRLHPRQLSGGMRMRVSIARALVTEPDLLLMDEPFGALDEPTRNRLDADLAALWAERRFTVVFVTHSIYEAVFLSDRIFVMTVRPGRIFREVAIDEPQPRGEAFRNSPRFAEYCRAVSSALDEAAGVGEGSAAA